MRNRDCSAPSLIVREAHRPLTRSRDVNNPARIVRSLAREKSTDFDFWILFYGFPFPYIFFQKTVSKTSSLPHILFRFDTIPPRPKGVSQILS